MGFINDVTHVGGAVVVHRTCVRVKKRIKDKEYLKIKRMLN